MVERILVKTKFEGGEIPTTFFIRLVIDETLLMVENAINNDKNFMDILYNYNHDDKGFWGYLKFYLFLYIKFILTLIYWI